MKLLTARYSNRNIPASGLAPLGITLGYPRYIRYKLAGWDKRLAPDATFKDNPNQAEFKALYTAKLDALGGTVMDIINAAVTGYDGVVMLCYEDLHKPELFCHRTMLANWLYVNHGLYVGELSEASAVQPTLPRLAHAH